MHRYRPLLAILLAAVYTAVSAFGMGFVVCVEGDGRQNVEALGAACCASVSAAVAERSGDAASFSDGTSTGGDCDDCQAHLPAVDIEAMRIEDSRPDTSSPVLLSPPAVLPVIAWPSAASARRALHARAPPPRPSPTLTCLRSVVLRC